MINKLLSLIINILLTIITTILNVILLPITLLIKGLFPGVTNYIGSFNTLLNDYLFDGLRFAREVLFNLSGINRNLVGLAVSIPLAYFTFNLANASIKFLISIYRIYKTGKDS